MATFRISIHFCIALVGPAVLLVACVPPVDSNGSTDDGDAPATSAVAGSTSTTSIDESSSSSVVDVSSSAGESTTTGEPSFCGDGIIDPEEDCDDGQANADNAPCLSNCTVAVCGDAIVQGLEQCDDANADNNDQCTELCSYPACGDGFAQTLNGELCDDGDRVPDDECNNTCDSAGLWTDTFNGEADNNDVIEGIAADSSDNVIVVGSTYDVTENDNLWIRKYDPSGGIAWTRMFHVITSDIAYGVAVAANDDIFVAGSTFTASDGRDIWIRRYSPGGDGGFVSTQNGGGDSHDEAFGIAIDPGGNLLVAGYVTTASDERDIWVRKYTATGTIEWTDIVSGPDADDDEAHAIASDGIGNVLVTGFVRTGSSGEDIWVRKYDADGGELWTRTVDGPSAGPDNGKGIAADSAGNVIVVGWETTATHGTDVWLRKYDSNGDELWTRTYDAPQHGTDLGESVAVDSSDNVVVAGTIYRGVQSHNVWVRKYDPDGNERWTSVYNSNGFLADGANAVAVDDGDNVLIGGFETRSDLGQARNTWVRRILQ